MVAPARRRNPAYRPPELAHHDHQRFVELPARLQVGQQGGHAVIQRLAHRRQRVGGRAVDILVHVPTAERDLDIARALIGGQHLPGHQARCAEGGLAVAGRIVGRKLEGFIDYAVVHQPLSRFVEILIIGNGSSQGRIDAQGIVESMQHAPAVVDPAGSHHVGGIGKAETRIVDIGRELERRVLRGKVAGSGLVGRVEREKCRKHLARAPLRLFLDGHHAADIGRDVAQGRRRVPADLYPGLRKRMDQRPRPDRADDGHVGELRRHFRQQSGRPGDTIEHFRLQRSGSIRRLFEIERVGVAGRARQQNEDDVLCLPLQGDPSGGNVRRGERLRAEQHGPGHSCAKKLEKLPAAGMRPLKERLVAVRIPADEAIESILSVHVGAP